MKKKIKILLILASFLLFQQVFAIDLKSRVSDKFYSGINEFSENLAQGLSDKLKQNENIKYFDISLDLQENQKPTIEIQSVSKIKEDTDSAFFNQTNLSSYDGETTLNLGFGKRKLFKDETVMLGSNIFIDYQFDESHLRNGLGVEAISSVFDLRGNYYNAISGFKATDEGREKALDGYDLQLNFHITGKTNTDLYLNTFDWENPNSTYEVKGEKFGITSNIGNFNFDLGYLNDNKNNDGYFAGVKLVVPLGDVNKKPKVQNKPLQYTSVREKLYIPVKRENKIKVVKISKSGVKISGF
ncbi:MAG: inverse autotransporter beta domain-containing protein [Candidatus Pelagibacter sp.]